MKKFTLILTLFAALTGVLATGQTFDSSKPLLPASKWHAAQTYQPLVWIYNSGQSFGNYVYKPVWAVPADDAEGRPWYHPDYASTSSLGIDWQTLPSPFYTGTRYGGVNATPWIQIDKSGDIYMRRAFTLSGTPDQRLFLSAGHDDAPSEWYINGHLVYSVSSGWNESETYLLTDEQMAYLKFDGSVNVLAVHVHQDWGGAFADCGLYYHSTPGLTKLLPWWGEAHEAWPCVYRLLNNNNEITTGADATWADPDLDESDWIEGAGVFGNNGTYATYWNSLQYPLLVRRHFTLTDEQLADALVRPVNVVCSYDEYPKVYLNGVQICQWNRWNDANYDTYTLTDEQKSLLRVGDNVLAVSLQSGTGGGHIDYGLTMQRSTGVLTVADLPLLATPGNIVIDQSQDSNLLTWDPVASATQYRVYRSADGTDFALLATVSDPTYTDDTALSDAKYYQVQALGASGAQSTLSVKVPTIEQGNQTINGHEYVDLGLPSGLKWATCNIGADSPEERGDCFAWGEIATKNEYNIFKSALSGKTEAELLSEGKVDASGTLAAALDPASVKWGGAWRMPSEEEFRELAQLCTWTWTERNGVNGAEVTGPNGNSIFIPAAGNYHGFNGEHGRYWSSTSFADDDRAWACYFDENKQFTTKELYGTGIPVRPVIDNPAPTLARPKNVKASIAEGVVSVTWDTVVGATSYTVYRSADGSDYTELGAAGTCSFTDSEPNDGDNYYRIQASGASAVSAMSAPSPVVKKRSGLGFNDYDYVDLGLPSGILWATTNLGGDQPSDLGDYHAWGEISTKPIYSEATSTYNNKSTADLLSQGVIDANGNLTADHDAAAIAWGGAWRMPTDAEIYELIDNCTFTWGSVEGRYGVTVTGPNGRSIFLPAAGSRINNKFDDDVIYLGRYWSSTPGDNITAHRLGFNNSSHDHNTGGRWYGEIIRPVAMPADTRPATPDNLIATATGAVISLTWDACDRANTYNIYRSANGTDFTLAGTSDTPAFIDVMPNSGVNYYRVQALDSANVAGEMSTATDAVTFSLDYVDLGLPSGLKWAPINVGAASVEDAGCYYAWGETETKDSYAYNNHAWYSKTAQALQDEGIVDSNLRLAAQYDVATAKWGSYWRLPTAEEASELRSYCTWTWTEQEGINGYIVKGPNNNTIFLPAAGYRNVDQLTKNTEEGRYMLAEVYTSGTQSRCLSFTNVAAVNIAYTYTNGYTVRPVSSTIPTLGMPQNVAASIADGAVAVTWDAVADATYYVVYRNSGNTFNIVSTQNTCSYTDSDPQPGANLYRVQAFNDQGIRGEMSPATMPLYPLGAPTVSGHEYVDLGLPSGLKWATCNVGASEPEGIGQYYSWTMTTPYDKDTYRQLTNAQLREQGIIDSDNLLNPDYDAATVNMGDRWHMPSLADLQELVNNCDLSLSTINGQVCMVFTGSNGNSIYLPMAGRMFNGQLNNPDFGFYASASDYERSRDYCEGIIMSIFNGLPTTTFAQQNYNMGLLVRAVTEFSSDAELARPRPVTASMADGVITVAWRPVDDATRYEVYRSTDDLDFTLIATVTEPTYEDTTPDARSNYYRVQAFSSDDRRSAISASTPQVIIPYAPENLVGSVAGGTVTLTWDASEGAASYAIYRSTDAVNYVLIGNATTCSYTDAKAVLGSNYYRVQALGAYGSQSPMTAAVGPFEAGHAYVDLGLPSGLKWATCNIGASSPEAYGDYYAWGETETKESYTRDSNPWQMLSYSQLLDQGVIDSQGNLTAQYDAATANWGDNWRMPTTDEIKELMNRCTWTASTQNGVKGWIVKGPNNNTIFLPALGGYMEGTTLTGSGSYGYITSASSRVDMEFAKSLNMTVSSKSISNFPRYRGAYIRAVTDVPNASVLPAPRGVRGTAEDGSVTVTWDAITAATSYIVFSSTDGTNFNQIGTATSNSFVDASPAADPCYYRVQAFGAGDIQSVQSASSLPVYIDSSIDSHEYVDLGLPSRLMWSAVNLGAVAPDDFGNYYAWGEIETKPSYTAATSDWDSYNDADQLRQQGVIDADGILTAQYDAAAANWGFSWRIPTNEDMQELFDLCTWTWGYTTGDVYGYTVTGPNGNSIFIPAGGNISGNTRSSNNSQGRYWTADVSGQNFSLTLVLTNSASTTQIGDKLRYWGYSVRPVMKIPGDKSLAVPTGLQATATDGTIAMNWTGVPGASAYAIHRSTDGTNYTQIATSAGTAYTDATPTVGVNYYRVQAMADNGGVSTLSLPTAGNYIGEGRFVDGYEYVDLGLPSGLKWATCNVDAAAPDAFGNYYAWGETETKDTFTLANSTWGSKSHSELQSLGVIDENHVMTPSYDVASVKLGSNWRTPTVADHQELIDNCTISFTTLNGVNGFIVTGPNGKSIFIPAAGYIYNTNRSFLGSSAYLLCADTYGTWTRAGLLSDGFNAIGSSNRYDGLTVRAVTSQIGILRLATPGSVQATEDGRSIIVTWNPVNGAESYAIYRSADDTDFVQIGTSNTATYTDGAPLDGLNYYRVQALCESSDPSSLSASSEPIDHEIVPEMPVNVQAAASQSVIVVTWDEAADATSYSIYRSTDGNGFTFIGTSTSCTYTDASPKNGPNYYRVQAMAANGNLSAKSAITAPVSFEDSSDPTINGHEYVDLGLPSGLKWATCNVGADSPQARGDYFAWGETEGKTTFTNDNYAFNGITNDALKADGVLDENGNLTADYDAATANWGGPWRMPTIDDVNELINNCKIFRDYIDGEMVFRIVGPNGNFIYLPAAGYMYGESMSNTSAAIARVATAEINSYTKLLVAERLGYNDKMSTSRYANYCGVPVRPVAKKVSSAGTADPVVFDNCIVGSYLYSFVSPVDGTVEGADVYEFAGILDHDVYGTPVDDGIIKAGMPYIFIAYQTEVSFTPDANSTTFLTSALPGEYGMRGVLADDVTPGYEGPKPYYLAQNGTHLVFSNGEIRNPRSAGGTKIGIGKCYIIKSEAFIPKKSYFARKVGAYGVQTGADDIEVDNMDIEWFNLQGIQVSNNYKGLVISKGNKTVRK